MLYIINSNNRISVTLTVIIIVIAAVYFKV